MNININLLCHICLDSDTKGRFGVQGNIFANTFGYLNDYLTNYSNLPSHLVRFQSIMRDLVIKEGTINTLDDEIKLTRFAEKTRREIIDGIRKNKTTMLPGGWVNENGGHAMIYQFETTGNGKLRFSIYNAGAGVNKHERTSFTTTERFYPVKSYEIPYPVNETELTNLISALILPNLPPRHPTRKKESYNADKLYNKIGSILPHLKAKPLLAAELLNENVTTAGQISGTCSQRSIHQLLKINFNNLPKYQRFILDFKMHALDDFIKTHPEPRAKQIANILKKIIINNLKIVKEPNVFDSSNPDDMRTKKELIEQLSQLKQQVTRTEAIRPNIDDRLHSPPPSYNYKINVPRLAPHFASNQLTHIAPPSPTTALPPLTPKGLSKQIEKLIQRCDALKDTDPMWVFEQIEQAILTLPIPSQSIAADLPISSTNIYQPLPFFAEITTKENYTQIETQIEQLQKLYITAYSKLLITTQLPHLIVTQTSFLALRDYFYVRNPKQLTSTHFHTYLNVNLAAIAAVFKSCPFAATNNDLLDQRLVQLASVYQGGSILDAGVYFIDLYNEIIKTEPQLKAKLESHYRNKYSNNFDDLHKAIHQAHAQAAYALFSEIESHDPRGNPLCTLKPDSMLDKTIFQPILEKIKRQLSLEHFFVNSFTSLLNINMPAPRQLQLGLKPFYNKDDPKLELSSPTSSNAIAYKSLPPLTAPPALPNHKYNLKNPSPSLKALMADYQSAMVAYGGPRKITSNTIQLQSRDEPQVGNEQEPITRIINQDDFFKRELFHLRTSRSNQINFTIDYFKSNLDKLSDQSIQQYMEANIFEPALLHDAMINDPTLVQRFDELVQKGLHRFKNKDELTSNESIFFIRLRFLANRYLNNIQRLEQDLQHISLLINEHHDPAILASLHQYRFLTAMAMHKLDTHTPFNEALQSHFYQRAKSNAQIQNDTATAFEIQRAQHQFMNWASEVPKAEIKNKINSILRNLGLDISNLTPEVDPNNNLIYKLKVTTGSSSRSRSENSYTVNVGTGQVFLDNKSYCAIPLNIRLHSVMRRLGIEQESSCFAWNDGQTFEFITHDQHLRIIQTPNGLTVQKEWTIKGQTGWYELRPLTETQHYAYKLSNSKSTILTNELPPHLTDNRMQAWVGVTQAGSLFLTENLHPKYLLQPNNQLELLTSNNDKSHLITSIAQADLNHFEDSGFINIAVNSNQQTTGRIDLIRYGITLELTAQRIKLAETDYTLEPNAVSPFASTVACLNLTKTEDSVTRKQCIVAVQPFYVNHAAKQHNQDEGDFFRLDHDINNTVTKDALESYWDKKKIPLHDQPLWDYKQSAKSITYNLVDSKPKPDNAADALYLCYLYLSTNETKKAWDVLDDLRKGAGLSGDPQELTYLSWIINKLPSLLSLADLPAKLETPEYVACQLKALALLTDFSEQGKTYLLPNKNDCDLSTANGHYEAICIEETQAFYNQLPSTIHSLYSQSLKLDRHFDADFNLLDSECLSLLNHIQQEQGYNLFILTTEEVNSSTEKQCYLWDRNTNTLIYVSTGGVREIVNPHDMSIFLRQLDKLRVKHVDSPIKLSGNDLVNLITSNSNHVPDDAPQPLGALGYEWRRLCLKSLLKIYNQLCAIRDSAHSLPIILEKRLNDIEAQLDIHLPVMKQSTLLETAQVNLTLPQDIKLKLMDRDTGYAYRRFQNSIYDPTNSPFYPDDENIALAELNSSITEHQLITNLPFYIKVAKDNQHPHFYRLKEFCEAYLKGNCHTPISKQPTNIPLWINLLYRLIHTPKALESSRSYSFSFLHALKSTPTPELSVLQTKNVFKDELKKSKVIWDTLKAEMPISKRLLTQPLIEDKTYSLITLVNNHVPMLQPFCEKYRAIENEYQRDLKEVLDSTLHTTDLKLVHEAELKAGALLYQCTQKQQQLAENNLKSSSDRNALLQNALINKGKLAHDLDEKLSNLERLANTQPSNAELAEKIQIEVLAELRGEITEQDLLKLYFNANEIAYREKTQLPLDKIEALHALIHEYVTLKVKKQQIDRLIEALEKTRDKPDEMANLHLIADVLMTENNAKAEHDPTLMLFQLEENILLRPRQVDALANLLSSHHDDPYKFNESVEKVIMGGGKSKVILPLLAQQKATGLNLVVVEVPRALLSTNHADLNSTSQRLFNQKANRFEFDRDSDCSPNRLQKIYNQFNEIIANKDYLVTTGESMQSLELKYLELTLTKPDNEKEHSRWKKQVYWASKIVSLLKNQGDVVIDELHQGLLLKRKLNYTLGDQQAIAPELIQHSVNLYLFLDRLAEKKSSPNSTIQSRMKTEWQAITTRSGAGVGDPSSQAPRDDARDGGLAMAPNQLVNALIDEDNSPLQFIIDKLTKLYSDTNVSEEIRAYLNDERESEKINAADPSTRDTLAFYKEQISLLPQTLSRHHKEHYGPSKLKSISALKRALSIPYSANDKPNERSRFGNPLETINYTIQSILSDGLSLELIIEIIEQWQIEAKQELQKNFTVYKNIDETPTAQGIAAYLENLAPFNGKKLTLQHLDIRNAQQMQFVFEHLKDNKSIILNLLQDKILKQITSEPAILHSDAYNHVDLYRSAQGLSGTPWNHTTYHQRLQFNRQTSLGSDGYIQTILQEKKTPLYVANFNVTQPSPVVRAGTPLTQYLNNLHQQTILSTDVRAIIDINATFAGVSNLNVARELATFFQLKPQNKIQYILYFNENDILCALDVKKPQLPIILTTSDPEEINRKLGCKPEDRFTYYDQAHTIGTDLKQGQRSCAIVLADEKTHLQHFLQGSMRMRGLKDHQTIKIVVPDTLQNTTLNQMLERMTFNENEQLSQDNFIATLAKMENIIRQKFLLQLDTLHDEDIETKHTWAKAFQSYFIETQHYRLFEQYGSINCLGKTETLLENHKSRLINDWTLCLSSLNIPPIETETTQLTNTLSEIIQQALPLCKAEYISRSNKGKQDLEVEAQKEKEIMKEQEKCQEEERFDPNLREVFCQRWDPNKAIEINEKCNQSEINSPFSAELKVSPNYAQVYNGQQKMLGFYLKPVHAIWFTRKNNTLTACIVSNQEAEEIQQLIKSNPRDPRLTNGWLTTTLHTTLAGQPPSDILMDLSYQSLMEQVRFFNGECNVLLDQSTPYVWLKTQTGEKLRYFERHILPYRETKPSAFFLLQAALSKKTEGFDYIQDHLFEDLRYFNWKAVFPDTLPADVNAFQTLAQAFYNANQTFQTQQLDAQTFKKDYGLLPPAATAYLDKHIKLLNAFKDILSAIKSKAPDQLTLDLLTAEEKTTLTTILQVDIDIYIKKHQVNDTILLDNVSLNLVNLDVLFALVQSNPVKNDATLMQLIQKNPLIGNATLTPLTQENLLIAILKNPDTGITAQHFEQLQAYTQTAKTLKAQCEHAQLSVHNIGSILKQYASIEQLINDVSGNKQLKIEQIAGIIGCVIRENNLKKPEATQALIENYFLKKNHHLNLINAMDTSIDADEALALFLNDTYISPPTFKVIITTILKKSIIPEHTFNCLLSNPQVDATVRNQILNININNKTMYPHMLKAATLPDDILQKLVEKATDDDAIFKTIVEHPSFKSIQAWVLKQKNTLSVAQMILFIEHSKPPLTAKQLEDIISSDHPATWGDHVLSYIVYLPHISWESLSALVQKHPISTNLFEKVIAKKLPGDTAQTVYKNFITNATNAELVQFVNNVALYKKNDHAKLILNKAKISMELIKLITANNTELLEYYVKDKNDEQLSELIKEGLYNTTVLNAILVSTPIKTKTIQAILIKTDVPDEDKIKIINKLGSLDNSSTEAAPTESQEEPEINQNDPQILQQLKSNVLTQYNNHSEAVLISCSNNNFPVTTLLETQIHITEPVLTQLAKHAKDSANLDQIHTKTIQKIHLPKPKNNIIKAILSNDNRSVALIKKMTLTYNRVDPIFDEFLTECTDQQLTNLINNQLFDKAYLNSLIKRIKTTDANLTPTESLQALLINANVDDNAKVRLIKECKPSSAVQRYALDKCTNYAEPIVNEFIDLNSTTDANLIKIIDTYYPTYDERLLQRVLKRPNLSADLLKSIANKATKTPTYELILEKTEPRLLRSVTEGTTALLNSRDSELIKEASNIRTIILSKDKLPILLIKKITLTDGRANPLFTQFIEKQINSNLTDNLMSKANDLYETAYLASLIKCIKNALILPDPNIYTDAYRGATHIIGNLLTNTNVSEKDKITLLKEIPGLELVKLAALIKDKNQSEDILIAYLSNVTITKVELVKPNEELLITLLDQTNLTKKVLEKMAQLASNEDTFDKIIEKISEKIAIENERQDLLNIVLTKAKANLDIKLIKKITLKNNRVHPVFSKFIKNCSDRELATLIDNNLFETAYLELLIQRIKTDESDQTLRALLTNQKVDATSKICVINACELSSETLIYALKNDKSYRLNVLDAFLTQKNLTDEVLTTMIDQYHRTLNDALFEDILKHCKRLSTTILKLVATKASRTEVLETILNKTTDDSIRTLILFKDKVVTKVIKKITLTYGKANTLFTDFIKNRTDANLAELMTESYGLYEEAYFEPLVKQLKTYTTTKTIQALLSNKNVSEKQKIKLLTEFNLEKNTIVTLLKTYTNLDTTLLAKLIRLHTDSDDIRTAVVQYQKQLPTELIKTIAADAKKNTTLKHVMEHDKTDSVVIKAVINNKQADDTLYQQTIAHKAFTVEHAELLINNPLATNSLFKKLIKATYATTKLAGEILVRILNKTKTSNPAIYTLAEERQLELASTLYDDALQTIKNLLNPKHVDKTQENPRLRYFVKKIKQEIIKKKTALDKSDQPIKDKLVALNEFTSILKRLKTTVEYESNAIHHPEQQFYEDMGKKMLRSSTYNKLGRLLLALGGFLLIGASIAIGLLLGGVLAPISLYGIALGTALIGVGVTGSVSALAGTGLLFWSNKQSTEALNEGYKHIKSSP